VNRQAVFEQIQQDWSNEDDLVRDCQRVVTYLSGLPLQSRRSISFAMLAAASPEISTSNVIRIADYFTSARMHLLSKQYVLILDDDEFLMTLDEISEARKTGVMYHPEIGEEIPNYDESLFLFFSPTELGREVFGEGISGVE
jgi:hypothetical protein